MKKFLTLFLAVLCAAAFCAAPFAKIKNQSKDRLSVKQKNGVFTLVLTNDKGNDSEASFTIKNIAPKQKYEFSCDLEAESRSMVYLQVKHYKNKKISDVPETPPTASSNSVCASTSTPSMLTPYSSI